MIILRLSSLLFLCIFSLKRTEIVLPFKGIKLLIFLSVLLGQFQSSMDSQSSKISTTRSKTLCIVQKVARNQWKYIRHVKMRDTQIIICFCIGWICKNGFLNHVCSSIHFTLTKAIKLVSDMTHQCLASLVSLAESAHCTTWTV